MIVVYTQPECPPCRYLERLLAERGIAFVHKDIRADDGALQELLGLGSQTTPTLVAGGQVMMGLDLDRLEGILAAL